jgi:hypothetical protein
MKTLKNILSLCAVVMLTIISCTKSPTVPQPPHDQETPSHPEETEKRSIKILAIGNSFSADAMEYLYGVLKDVGYEEIVLGNIYKGGCTLEQHAGYFQSNSGADYTYYQNTTGSWTNTAQYPPLTALTDYDWDYITMQQGSPKSGQSDTFDPYLDNMVKIITQHCPDAKLAWHMTWAYQANSTHSGFANYGKNQMTMYNAIVSAVKTKILTNSSFSKVIPNGTAVQNMRTSYVGDNLTRDGYHMSYSYGRYLTALTFAKALTGCDLSKVTYIPSGQNFTEKDILAMKEAADNAVATPYKVTASQYPPEFDYATATFEQILESEGYDPSKYVRKDISWTKYAYYNSSNTTMKSTLYTADNKNVHNQTNYVRFVASPIFAKDEIPNGSVILVRPGAQYRPEGWVELDLRNGGDTGRTRPANVSTMRVEVNDSWWGNWKYRAFNLSFTSGENLTDASAVTLIDSFAIFVPSL